MDRLRRNLYNESSTDSSDLSSSDDEVGNKGRPVLRCWDTASEESDYRNERNSKTENIVLKLFNRERTGYLNADIRSKCNQKAFSKVPNRLSFCLKDIVPYCYLQGHMFMGLTVCGQFLISYKVCYDESFLVSNLNFTTFYKYTLYFWIYRPHQPLSKYFKVVMFDDHGVDNLKAVTMSQWYSNPRILVVHGASEAENEDSYITIVRVPKLGCIDCKDLREREFNEDGYFRCDALCIKCNLTIHSKYSTSESDPKFNPYMNLICPEKILLVANGFIHALNIDLEIPKSTQQQSHIISNQGTISYHPQQIQSQNMSPFLLHQKDFANADSTLTQSSNNLCQISEKVHNSLYTATAVAQDLNSTPCSNTKPSQTKSRTESELSCDNKNNIVARIFADFTDIENETMAVTEKQYELSNKKSAQNYDELIFTCGMSTSIINNNSMNRPTATTLNAKQNSNANLSTTKVNLLNHSGRRNHKIVTKSFRNGVTTIDLQAASTSTAANNGSNNCSDKADSAYEFSEDNEKCEKIGTFRKRRLADKKYEFSEDNSENIIPFTKTRFRSKNTVAPSRASKIHHRPFTPSHYHSTGTGTVYLSTSASQSFETTSHLHRASPSQGFRSPCGSPVGAGSAGLPNSLNNTSIAISSNRLVRSPVKANQGLSLHKSSPSHSPNSSQASIPTNLCSNNSTKSISTLSPVQISVTKRSNFELGNMSPTNRPFLSPCREDSKVFEVPLVGTDLELSEKPTCAKKLRRHYVEENDAVSVITSEEDDCISPGYHTSLPMEVHGSCYSDMQMISKNSYQQLCCPIVIITQHSFDLETFTYYAITNLCSKNNKTYDVFYDWACEIVNVCPHSNSVICTLMAHFTARDKQETTNRNAPSSISIKNTFQRKKYECRILFCWNLETSNWEVLDYGQLNEINLQPQKLSTKTNAGGLTTVAKQLAAEISENLMKKHNYKFNLRVLDSNIDKSKNSLVDLDNMIEFYRKKPKFTLESSMFLSNSDDSDDTTILD
ncbi:uncharacterized protein LOC129611773 [Condylostylus longicornis]|uniref:uncharacterized protein LOC129611773 n=1 Tax=Condylostylus longicornis TaxID=2530218 RepID=UPI00244DB22B|nr:uncharacterized protein LOC129611773 [Condylostylus longicornis]